MKKCMALLLSLVMILAALPTALAAPPRDLSAETVLAGGLKELGLFLGRGQHSGPGDDFDLAGKPTRAEALTMLLRALGKGREAEAHGKTHPFSDVPAWADGYVSYAYEQGLTKGVTATRFDAEKAATADIYLTFMLRALGYTEGIYDGDFTWNSPYALAARCGMLPVQVDRDAFLRADVVTVTCAALFAKQKGTETRLHEALAAEEVFTREAFQKAFPQDPFARFHEIEAQVTNTLARHLPLGPLGTTHSGNGWAHSEFGLECHVITAMTELDGVLKLTVWVHYGVVAVDHTQEYHGSSGSIAPWYIELDANTLEELSCLRPGTRFTESEVREQGRLRDGMWRLSDKQGRQQFEEGIISHPKANYDEALAKVKAALTDVQLLEADTCTVVIGKETEAEVLLYLVFKPGSKQGEGTVNREVFYAAALSDVRLSEDGKQLQCSYRYENGYPLLDEPGKQLYPKTGTVVTKINLETGYASVLVYAD